MLFWFCFFCSPKVKYLKDGDGLVGYKKEELELKYLIKKELYKIEPRKNDLKELKSLLQELVCVEPKYQIELTQIHNDDLFRKSGFLIGTIMFLLIWMLYLFWK